MKHFATLKRLTVALALAACLLGAGACSQSAGFRGQAMDEPKAPLLAGQNWDGKSFDLSDLSGKVTLVFFGYTSCPDVCPFTLLKMKKLYARLGDRAEDVRVVFASVDPHRDSVEKLSQYVPNFDKRFYGVHLPNDKLEQAMESFELTVQYGQPKDGPGTDSYYYVDHTGTFFLLGRDGTVRVTFPPNATVEDLEADVVKLLGGA